MHRVLIVQAYCPVHGELRMMFPPRPIDHERCPVCAGPVLAHLLGWGTTTREQEICERFYVGEALRFEIQRRWRESQREVKAEELALAKR